MVVDQLPDFTQCTEVAALACGGKILFATDDFFAAAECMLRDSEPIFIAEKCTDYGKWMDGWETRRKRTAGHDWCIIRLSGPTTIKGFLIDTAHFTGNYAPKISIQAALLPPSADNLAPSRKPDVIGRAPSNRDFDKIARLKSNEWTTIVPMMELQPGYENTRYTYIHNNEFLDKYTHLRLNLHPDGGIARFRVYGDIELDTSNGNNCNAVIDMMNMQNGGRCLAYLNAHFGHPRNLNKPSRAANMMDGWETARRLDRPAIIEMTDKDVFNIPGSEWAIFRLGAMTTIVSIDIDTNHFKGNAPDYVTIEGTTQRDDSSTNFEKTEWVVVLDKVKMQPHKLQSFKREIKNTGPFNCMRITMAPDGGISRVRIHGQRFIEKPVETANSNAETDNSNSQTTNSQTDETNNSNDVDSPPTNNTNDSNSSSDNDTKQPENNGSD